MAALSTLRVAIALAGLAGAVAGCQRKVSSVASPPPAAETAASSPSPFHVLVWVESTPPDARIVRVSDGAVLAHTPETVELLQSTEPVLLRLELAGYRPVTRSVPVASDGRVSVTLEPSEPPGKKRRR